MIIMHEQMILASTDIERGDFLLWPLMPTLERWGLEENHQALRDSCPSLQPEDCTAETSKE